MHGSLTGAKLHRQSPEVHTDGWTRGPHPLFHDPTLAPAESTTDQFEMQVTVGARRAPHAQWDRAPTPGQATLLREFHWGPGWQGIATALTRSRTWTDMEALCTALRERFASTCIVPSASVPRLGGIDPGQVYERQLCYGTWWLDFVCWHPVLSRSPLVCAFLTASPSEWGKFQRSGWRNDPKWLEDMKLEASDTQADMMGQFPAMNGWDKRSVRGLCDSWGREASDRCRRMSQVRGDS